MARRPDRLDRRLGRNPGAGGDIKHPLAGGEAGGAQEGRDELARDVAEATIIAPGARRAESFSHGRPLLCSRSLSAGQRALPGYVYGSDVVPRRAQAASVGTIRLICTTSGSSARPATDH